MLSSSFGPGRRVACEGKCGSVTERAGAVLCLSEGSCVKDDAL
jgi:hypothetical protein